MSTNLHRKPQLAPAQKPSFNHTVKTVKATFGFDGGVQFETSGEFHVHNLSDAKDAADRLQEEFDSDCDPCRTYVYREGEPAPLYAGLQFNPRKTAKVSYKR